MGLAMRFMFLVCATIFWLSSAQAQGGCQELNGASVFSNEPVPVFLGFFGNEFASESINNSFGQYGSEFQNESVRNPLGRYGSETSSTSANNPSALSPPRIIKNGQFLAYLSSNEFLDWSSLSLSLIDSSCTFSATSSAPFYAQGTGGGGTDVSLQGSWYNPDRSGEGFVFDFFTSGPDHGVVVYFYTYNLSDEPMYLIGSMTDISPGSFDPISVEVVKTQGTSFGSVFDADSVVREMWGTLTIEFDSCNSATVSWDPVVSGYEAGSTDIVRLVPLGSGVTCP